jgi:hypothetical protein
MRGGRFPAGYRPKQAGAAEVVRAVARKFFLPRNAAFLVVLCGLLASTPAVAQEAPQARQAVRVGLYVSPPFVTREHGRFTGMAVELWEALAGAQGLRSEYHELPTVRALIEAAASGAVDVAVTNLTITRNRAQRIDFTHPWFDAGLRIMVNEHQGAGFRDIVGGLRDSGYLRAYAWLAFVVVAATGLLTLFDRKFDPDFPRRWRDGAAESFFAIMSVVAGRPSGRRNIFGWVGRVWQGVWLVCGIAVICHFFSDKRHDHSVVDQPDQQPCRSSWQASRGLYRQRLGGICLELRL